MLKDLCSLPPKKRLRLILTMLIFVAPVLIYTATGALHMYQNRLETLGKYDADLVQAWQEQTRDLVVMEGSQEVKVGVYMESISDVSVKDNKWSCKFLLWFRWQENGWEPSEYPGEHFIVGNGRATSKVKLEDAYDEATGVHYQQYRVTADVEKYFDTTRYPLESHQLKIFIEDGRDMSMVRYVEDREYSALSPYLIVAGFDVINYDCGIYVNEYSSKMNDPVFDHLDVETNGKKTYEFMFVTRVKRDGYGLFLKAFLNLFGILLWVCIGLYNSAYNRVDPMGAINTGIFGAVSSMIVGMNLLSDARGHGLIEYINLFSLAMILVTTIYVMRLNHMRSHKLESETYTDAYAKLLFWTVVILCLVTITAFILCARS